MQNNIVNHIAILLDKSGSMQPLAKGVIDQYNSQAVQISGQSATTGQKTLLSLYTFSYEAEQPILVEVPMDLVTLKPLDSNTYKPQGGTAMLDSIGLAIDQLSRFERGINDSFLIIVITDGEENSSHKYNSRGNGYSEISNLISTKIKTDMWSFVFLVPKGDKVTLIKRLNLYEGNVLEWDQTDKGVQQYSQAIATGISNYYTQRATGVKSTRGFFTNLAGVSTTQVAKNLINVSGSFFKAVVSLMDCNTTDSKGRASVDISEFCYAAFNAYTAGSAFYELTKREEIQVGKEIVIEDLSTGEMFSGEQARSLLGFPVFTKFTVAPGDQGKFRVYIQSKSQNRKLNVDQHLLYLYTK